MDACHDFFVCSSAPLPPEPPPSPSPSPSPNPHPHHHDLDLSLSLGAASPPAISTFSRSSSCSSVAENPLLPLPSRDQVWQSLHRNGSPSSAPQATIWNRRSASAQIFPNTPLSVASIRRSSSSSITLQRHSSLIPRHLSDLDSFTLSSMQKQQQQQEALEAQKKREIQAQRRGKRRSLMDEKLQWKKAKQLQSNNSESQRLCSKLSDDDRFAKQETKERSLLYRNAGSSARGHGSSEEDESKGVKGFNVSSDVQESGVAAADGEEEDGVIDSHHRCCIMDLTGRNKEVGTTESGGSASMECVAEGKCRNGSYEAAASAVMVIQKANSDMDNLVSDCRRRQHTAEHAATAAVAECVVPKSLNIVGVERQQSWPTAAPGVLLSQAKNSAGGGGDKDSGGTPSAEKAGTRIGADLMWVSTTGRGPNGKTISGVMYITTASGRRVARLICACHGKHMSALEFVEHSGSCDLSNPERRIVVNPLPFLFRQSVP